MQYTSSPSSHKAEPLKREHGVKTIGTRDGKFHCHDVLASYLLTALPGYKNARYVHVCIIIIGVMC